MTRWTMMDGNCIKLSFNGEPFDARIVWDVDGVDVCYVPVFSDDDETHAADRIAHEIASDHTRIESFKNNIPAVQCEEDQGGMWRFWCPFCRKHHTHGAGEGHRVAHCGGEPPITPFDLSGYYLIAPVTRT